MTYNKPEIVVLGEATREIQGGGKSGVGDNNLSSNPGPIPFELED